MAKNRITANAASFLGSQKSLHSCHLGTIIIILIKFDLMLKISFDDFVFGR